MDILASADLAAVARTWGEVKKDLPTHAPNFYIALLTAHPEYHPLFPSIANTSMADLPGNAALQTLSVNVLTKLSSLIEAAGNPDVLKEQLLALGADHKKLGVKRSDFDNVAAVLLNFLASSLGAGFSDADRAAWATALQGINTIVETAL